MIENGFIKLYRSILTWQWYTDPVMRGFYIHLLLTVNISEGSFRGIPIKPGMRVCSYSQLAAETGMTMMQVRWCIEKLKGRGLVRYDSYKDFSILTLIEPEKFSTEISTG